mmetsp:Transcript_10653/g.17008  ORF Transcript_10653/g.17008 Transcript_10653/m.17008 type:complete len:204 (-) Transcript_10653:247-858(-)
MINFFSNFTNGCNAGSNNSVGQSSKKRPSRGKKPSNKNRLEPDLNSLEEMNLENILMVGNLSHNMKSASSSKKGDNDVPRGHDVEESSISSAVDDNSTALQEMMESLRKERDSLKERCKELEDTVFNTRQENDLWKVKMTMAMGSLRSQIDSVLEDKNCLEEKCARLSNRLDSLRKDYTSKLDVISSLESELKEKSAEPTAEI